MVSNRTSQNEGPCEVAGVGSGNKMMGRPILLSFRFLAELLSAAKNGRYESL